MKYVNEDAERIIPISAKQLLNITLDFILVHDYYNSFLAFQNRVSSSKPRWRSKRKQESILWEIHHKKSNSEIEWVMDWD